MALTRRCGYLSTKSASTRLMFIAAVFFSMLICQFIEYDVTKGTKLVGIRPGWTYPVVSAFIYSTGISLALIATENIRSTICAAWLAWCFYSLTGFLVEAISGTSFITWPFPFMVPLSIFMVLSDMNEKQVRELVKSRWFAFTASTLIYWSIVVFAPWTGVPHRVYGTWPHLLLGFMLGIPILTLVTRYLSHALLRVTQA
jgi:hypothetical protein